MSVDELKSHLSQLAGSVMPDEDPYGRLMRRARQRRRTRRSGLGAALAGLLVAVLGFGPGLVGGWPDRPPAGDGYPVDSEWTWRLIGSPTRGNLADDATLVADLTRTFDEDRDETRMASSLAKVKVLFVHDFATSRSVVVAYHSDSAAALVTRTARRGASADTLISAGGMGNWPLKPFTVLGESMESGNDWSAHWLLGLAPAGCTVRTSAAATLTTDGTVRRTWQPVPTGDHVLYEDRPVQELWQVICDGVVRHQGPAGYGVDEIGGSPATEVPRAASPVSGEADDETARAALASYRTLVGAAGLVGGDPVVLWGGPVPDGQQSTPAVLLGPANGPGPVVLQVGASPKALVALASPDHATPDDTETEAASRKDWSLVSTTTADSTGHIAVRIPERDGGHAVLTDRLLVVGLPDAVRVEAGSRDSRMTQSSPLTDGSALTVAPIDADVILRALNVNGKTVNSFWVREPTKGEHLFGEDLISNW